MINTEPLISILMNCYNGEKYLQEAVDSVISQTYSNWELIFWDNQSNDSSAKKFLEYKDSRLKYFYSQKHTDLGDARVNAISKAKGSWIGILDIDDVWTKEKLECQVEVINQSNTNESEIGLIYGRVLEIDEMSNEVGELAHSHYKKKKLPEGLILKELLINGNFIMNPSILFSMKAFKEIGGFPKGYLNASDYFITCAISSKYSVGFVNKYVAKYREHGDNLTLSQKVVAYEEQLMVFSKWANFTDLTESQKLHRVKELNTMIALMEIKYQKNFIKGIKIIFSQNSVYMSMRMVTKHLFSILKFSK